ncbi:MAG: acetoacetate--CoA ligase [Gammaproteobacteria bacterium]|nr:acetoacetate--CoA ligase [Gammaproteobacteria bacterium]MCP4089098.1 acetoacetate--CoA ligase [Gammaproteobacteria bacterium]MCP4276877.1 acetoacetate--CoA ligase [Gammaproteobacteria bacterium]MCP4830720.1 acetoacetate--CoA ligase [Gammaproteobacteria bacterium]
MTIEQPVWEPNASVAAGSHMAQFAAGIEANTFLFKNYSELHSWSIENPGQFWSEVARYTDIKFTQSASSIFKQSGDMQTARWFEGSSLNFAANLLAGPNIGSAIIFHDERGNHRVLSRVELVSQVAALAAGMRAAGIRSGDRVAALLPNCPEAVIVMLATASVGAVFSSCSPDFGLQAITGRFGQIAPRLMFVCDGYSYAGKRIDSLTKAAAVAAKIQTLENIVVVPFLDAEPDISAIESAQLLVSFCIKGSEPDYESLPFDHPLFIMFSSGTTGKPKCIVHGAGGTLLQHKKELMLHTDVHAGDAVFFFTTCGWMMWNWLISALAVKAAVVLYDGSPFYPNPGVLLRMAAEEGVVVFGTSPRYLTALQKDQKKTQSKLIDNIPVDGLPALRTLLSTGAPLAPESYNFVQASLGEHIQVSSISGGTDLISCFALGNPLLPVYRGELQCRGLGMAVEVFNDNAESVIGEMGELVCTKAFPSMPLGFWNDPGEAYTAAYFQHFPGVWAHGDLAKLTDHDGLIIYGRSDAVLNPGGVRIGSSEVCEPAMMVEGVADAIAVGRRSDGEEKIILFVVLSGGTTWSEVLGDMLREAIRSASSPRHVPDEIYAVPDIPRTMSGKVLELAVRAIVQGESVGNIEAAANPESLEYFRIAAKSAPGSSK